MILRRIRSRFPSGSVRRSTEMASVSSILTAWSRSRARVLPWRRTRNPYRIWVSEIMLAQTRVETVLPYYRRFLKRFPTLRSLSRSTMQTVLKTWEGLGYYARARNLHRAAMDIRKMRAGRFPRTAEEWRKLPGVGRYTAAAIAAVAFGEPAAALDANARRILARFYAHRRAIRGALAERTLAVLYQRMRGTVEPGVFFQALMDLGQLVCLPRRPVCGECPLARRCRSKQRGIQNRIPVRERPAAIPHYDVTAAVIVRRGKVLIARRPEGKLLGGMWEFPGGKRERGESLKACLRREIKEELNVTVRVREKLLAVEHAFSHFRITLHVFRCDPPRGRPRAEAGAQVRSVRVRSLRRYPMGKADRRAADWIARNLFGWR
jgi:A/G-specific adenine glycosylase